VGVAQPLAAIRNEVRTRLLEVKPAAFDFDQVFDHLGGRFTFRAREHRQTLEQLAV
jgi:hypothetical protein